jgi:putative transposase
MFTKVCPDFESQPVEIDGEDKHVHLLVNYPPKHAVSTLVNSLKGVSSRLLRLERPDLARRYWKGVLCSPPYFAASCGGAPIGILKAYIEQQKTPLKRGLISLCPLFFLDPRMVRGSGATICRSVKVTKARNGRGILPRNEMPRGNKAKELPPRYF